MRIPDEAQLDLDPEDVRIAEKIVDALSSEELPSAAKAYVKTAARMSMLAEYWRERALKAERKSPMRAKMHCDEISVSNYGPVVDGKNTKSAEHVRLNAVYGKDGSSNAEWSKATPSGQVTLTISNPGAWGHFKQGGFYYVDFFEATEDDIPKSTVNVEGVGEIKQVVIADPPQG